MKTVKLLLCLTNELTLIFTALYKVSLRLVLLLGSGKCTPAQNLVGV